MNAGTMVPTAGAKLLYGDNYMSGQTEMVGNADIDAIDLSQSTPATVLVSQAYGYFFLSPDKTQLLYSWNYAAGQLAGIWAMPVP